MIKNIKTKLQSKKGGLKELLYDNIGIFIVGVLIVVTIFAAGNSITARGTANKGNIDRMKYNTSTGFDGDQN